MKKYNFDKIIDRAGTYSVKTDILPEKTPKGALSLWVADMDFPCAEPILEALHNRIDNKIFGYSIYNSDCKSIASNWFKKRFDWDVDIEDIFYCPGVVPAVGYLIDMLSKEGDGILIQRPVYYPFARKITGYGRKIVNNSLVYKDGKYEIDFVDLEEKMSLDTTKGMILCSPHNPVGRVWTGEELKEIVRICSKYDKWIISDEIHGDLVRRNVKHIPLEKLCPEYRDQIITCTAPSKTFNLAGLQMSNIIIRNSKYKKLWTILVNGKLSIGTPNVFAVTAMKAAYEEGEEWLEEVIDYLDDNVKFVNDFFEKNMPKVKVVNTEGTYLMWIDFSAYCSECRELEELMLTKAGVVLDSGYIFGKEGEGFERINVACPKSILIDCLNRIKETFIK